ncbi:nucleoside-diphosphate kinase [Tardisphaera miroshnichenkoae]
MVKPDGVRRALTGEVILRLERKGLEIVRMEKILMEPEQAAKLYSPHLGKPFYESLVSFITSGPVVVMGVRGRKAISVVRKLIGSTDAAEAQPGTVRGDFSTAVQENVVHASSSPEDARRELSIFFPELVGEKEGGDD